MFSSLESLKPIIMGYKVIENIGLERLLLRSIPFFRRSV